MFKFRTKVVFLFLVAVGFWYMVHPSGGNAAANIDDIPANYVSAYRDAGHTCPHLDPALLAGIGWVETHHGQLDADGVTSGENFAHAGGPMQFIPETFNRMKAKHPDVEGDRYDVTTSVRAAAHLLCDSGLDKGNTTQALWAYNRNDQYRRDVLAAASRYRAAGI